jgi:hypothetical protein
MLAVNLDLPLMFLLLDGSLVNFHGGRMTFDQAKLRFRELQKHRIDGFWTPTYNWRLRRKLTPGNADYDPALASVVARGAIDPFVHTFHPPAWPYVKPLEDATAEHLSESTNLRSRREILSARGEQIEKVDATILHDRLQFIKEASEKAREYRQEFPESELNFDAVRREIQYGPNPEGVKLAISADAGNDSAKATTTPSNAGASNAA